MLTYEKRDVFSAPPGSILVHACNCRGVWGSGVAAGFKSRFLSAYRAYQAACLCAKDTALGDAFLWGDNDFEIGCLMTSRGYGADVDPPGKILESTALAVAELLRQIDGRTVEVYSPKINSGLFKVEWSRTEAVLLDQLKNYPNIKWIVCEV